MKKAYTTSIILIVLFAAVGCSGDIRESAAGESAQIEEIRYESDMCAFSDDIIETVRYGGRIEMVNGDIHNFMSVECLAGFYLELEDKSKVKLLKAVDFTHGKRLLPVDEMIFLHSRLRPSPNGMFLSALEASDDKMVTNIYDAYPGPLLSWDEVLELVRNEWDLTGVSASELRF